MWGWLVWQLLLILLVLPYSSELLFAVGFFWCASRVLLCVCVRRHGAFVLWKWLSSALLLFLGLLGFLFLVHVCSLLSDVLCSRIGVLVPGFTVFLVDYSQDYVLYSVYCLLDFVLCESVHCYRQSLFVLLRLNVCQHSVWHFPVLLFNLLAPELFL